MITHVQNKVPESFRGWDVGVLAQLPLYVQTSFPFLLTRKSAVHVDVVNELSDNVIHSKSFKASAEGLRQAHLKRFHECEMQYYNKVLWDQDIPRVFEAKAEDFGEFDDPQRYNGFSPSDRFLRDVWCEVQQERPVARLDPLVKGVPGEVREGCSVQ